MPRGVGGILASRGAAHVARTGEMLAESTDEEAAVLPSQIEEWKIERRSPLIRRLSERWSPLHETASNEPTSPSDASPSRALKLHQKHVSLEIQKLKEVGNQRVSRMDDHKHFFQLIRSGTCKDWADWAHHVRSFYGRFTLIPIICFCIMIALPVGSADVLAKDFFGDFNDKVDVFDSKTNPVGDTIAKAVDYAYSKYPRNETICNVNAAVANCIPGSYEKSVLDYERHDVDGFAGVLENALRVPPGALGGLPVFYYAVRNYLPSDFTAVPRCPHACFFSAAINSAMDDAYAAEGPNGTKSLFATVHDMPYPHNGGLNFFRTSNAVNCGYCRVVQRYQMFFLLLIPTSICYQWRMWRIYMVPLGKDTISYNTMLLCVVGNTLLQVS
jgi:hypothetical protein